MKHSIAWNTIRVASLVVVALSVCPEAYALQPLTAFEASAKEYNPDNRQADATAQQRAAQKDVATAALLPLFTAQAVATRNQYESTFTYAGRTLTLTPLDGRDAFLTLSVPLLNLGAWEQRRAAVLNGAAAEAARAETEVSVESSVALAYYQLLGAEAVRFNAQTSLDYAEKNAKSVRDRLELGVASELDLQRALADIARAQQDIATADQGVALGRRALESLSRLTPEPANQADYAEDDLREELPLSDWMHDSGNDLVAGRSAKLASDSAAAMHSAARAAWLPTIAAQGQEHFTNATGFTGRSKIYTITATATWRFDFALLPNVRAQHAALAAAKANEDKVSRGAQDAIYRAWYQVRTGIEKVRASRAQLKAATLAQDLAGERYEHGVATQLEVVQAQRDRFFAAVSAVQADAELRYSRALLRLAARRTHEGRNKP